MAANTLRELFLSQLHDIYDAEQRITQTLPEMAKAATSEVLSTAFEDHLEETREHVRRLEEVFEALGESPKRVTCKAIVGLLEEGKEMMQETRPPSVRDAALIGAAQKVEHYEMATYGCLRTWADTMDETQASKLLQKTLDEEGKADKKLTAIAGSLNDEAAEGVEGEEVEEGEMAPVRRTSSRPSGGKTRSR